MRSKFSLSEERRFKFSAIRSGTSRGTVRTPVECGDVLTTRGRASSRVDSSGTTRGRGTSSCSHRYATQVGVLSPGAVRRVWTAGNVVTVLPSVLPSPRQRVFCRPTFCVPSVAFVLSEYVWRRGIFQGSDWPSLFLRCMTRTWKSRGRRGCPGRGRSRCQEASHGGPVHSDNRRHGVSTWNFNASSLCFHPASSLVSLSVLCVAARLRPLRRGTGGHH